MYNIMLMKEAQHKGSSYRYGIFQTELKIQSVQDF